MSNYIDDITLNEIYVKEIKDPSFVFNVFEYTGEFESIVNKIKFVLAIEPGEVLGHPEFGINYDIVMWQGTSKIEDLKEEIYLQLTYFIPELENDDYKLEITHDVGTDGVRDFVILYINIKNKTIMDIVI